MKGYEITFYTQQDRLRGMTQMSEWLLTTAREMGLRGATIVTGSEDTAMIVTFTQPGSLSWPIARRKL